MSYERYPTANEGRAHRHDQGRDQMGFRGGRRPMSERPRVEVPNLPDTELREWLIARIEEIDQAKRDIKAQIAHATQTARDQHVPVDLGWLRRAKDKSRHLTNEREAVRTVLGDVNARIKQQNRQRHLQVDVTVAEEFVRVAKAQLSPDQYDAILDEATLRMVNKRERAQQAAAELDTLGDEQPAYLSQQ